MKVTNREGASEPGAIPILPTPRGHRESTPGEELTRSEELTRIHIYRSVPWLRVEDVEQMLRRDNLFLHERRFPFHDEAGLAPGVEEPQVKRIVPRGQADRFVVGGLVAGIGECLHHRFAIEVHDDPIVVFEGEGVLVFPVHVQVAATVHREAVPHPRRSVVSPREVDHGIDPGVLQPGELHPAPVVPQEAVDPGGVVPGGTHHEVGKTIPVHVPEGQ